MQFYPPLLLATLLAACASSRPVETEKQLTEVELGSVLDSFEAQCKSPSIDWDPAPLRQRGANDADITAYFKAMKTELCEVMAIGALLRDEGKAACAPGQDRSACLLQYGDRLFEGGNTSWTGGATLTLMYTYLVLAEREKEGTSPLAHRNARHKLLEGTDHLRVWIRASASPSQMLIRPVPEIEEFDREGYVAACERLKALAGKLLKHDDSIGRFPASARKEAIRANFANLSCEPR